MRRITELISFVLLFIALVGTTFSQPSEYPHPNLKWYTIESDHFKVHYHEGTARTGATLLKIGEDIYKPITELYQYEPDTKIKIIVMDTDDYSNGGAYYYDNKILIWVNSMDWDLRGSHNWLRNVLAHEFSHMVQLGASRKLPRRLPAVYLQALGYEEEKRPDVLYGFPHVIMSYPIAMTQVPIWLAEGAAQNQTPGFGYDTFDSHRDMILRTRVLTNTLLTFDEMAAFGKNTIGNESVYNQGYSLVSYIRRNWGDKALRDISHNLGNPFSFSFDKALKDAIGIKGDELYTAWKDSLEKFYFESTENIRQNPVSPEIIKTEGYGNFYPAFINQDEFVFLSNDGMDYMSLTGLFKHNIRTGETKMLSGVARSRPSVSPDGKWVAYSRKKGVIKGSHYEDLFLYSIERDKVYRLTRGARAFSPSFSPDGDRIVFALNFEGTKNLAVADLPDLSDEEIPLIESWKILTDFDDGDQIYNPIFTSDGSAIIFAYNYDGPRDIGKFDLATGEIDWILNSKFDERNPSLSSDGKMLYYSCDKTGIFNIYALDLESGQEELLTNALGGAFMPGIGPDGQMIFSDYADNGFRIAVLDNPVPVNPEYAEYIPDYGDYIPEPNFNDRELPEYKVEKYKPSFGKMFILPRLAYDVQSFKPGIYFYNGDFLNWFWFLGGFSFNGLTEEPRVFQSIARLNPQYLGDYDLFAVLEYTNIMPNVFLEAYNIQRKSHQEFEDEYTIVDEIEDPFGNIQPVYDMYAIDYRFALSEVDAGFRYKINDNNTLELRGIASQYRAKLKFDDGFSFSYTYFKGKSVNLKWESDYRLPGIHQDINPNNGGIIIAEIAREYNSFIDSFKVDAGLLKEVFTPYDYNRFSIQWEHYFRSPMSKDHAVNVRLNSSALDRNDVDDFFYLYAGGLPGLKGYSFYSLGGTRKFIGTLTYRLPIFKNVNKRFLHAYVHNLYFGIFADYGNAWVGDIDLSQWKKDIGFSVRSRLTSFFTYPTAVSFEAAYGLDEFEVNDEGFTGTYGKEWRYYLTILFDFNLFLGSKYR